MEIKKLSGVTTALITPFKNGAIDFESLERVIAYQVERNIDGFVVNGTTGESPTLEWDEVKAIAKFVRQTSPKTHLIIGVGSNSTRKVEKMLHDCSTWDIDGVMAVVPYYNKPTQEGLYLHFSNAAKATDFPMLIYNVPSRTVAAIELETIQRLAEISNVVGIKEASGNLDFGQKIRAAIGKNFLLLSGDDFTCIEFIKKFGDGVISVTSHLFSDEIKTMVKVDDRLLIKQFAELNRLAFAISSPIPIKAMLFLKGIIKSPELRLPLVSPNSGALDQLKIEMKRANLL